MARLPLRDLYTLEAHLLWRPLSPLPCWCLVFDNQDVRLLKDIREAFNRQHDVPAVTKNEPQLVLVFMHWLCTLRLPRLPELRAVCDAGMKHLKSRSVAMSDRQINCNAACSSSTVALLLHSCERAEAVAQVYLHANLSSNDDVASAIEAPERGRSA